MTHHSLAASAETKALTAHDSLDTLNSIFSAFRESNDERLSQIERRMSADVVTDEKVARIDRALDETKQRLDALLLDQRRPRLSGDGAVATRSQEREHKAAFLAYMRSGDGAGLKALEEKSMSELSGTDGGYLVPPPVEQEIMRRIANISPIRSIASVREISTASFRKAFSMTGPATGWVAETDSRAQTANQQIADMTFPAMELYAMPAATQSLLDDAIVDIEQWTASEVDVVFAEQEGTAFVNGNGTGRPTGFLSYPKVPVESWAWGKTGYAVTGVAGAFPATSPSDILHDLVYGLRAGYRQNARFVMNRHTQSAIRKFKTTTGEYLWAPPATLGAAASLLSYPLVEAEDMPDIAADSFSIAFGDFARGYLIVDRRGIRLLRDPYSNKPYVMFYTTKRVGGGMQDFEAIRLLKFGVA